MKKVLGWAVVAALVLGAAAFFGLRTVHDQETGRMLAAANRVDIPADWTLTSERIESAKLLCLNSNPCPSLHRSWQAPEELSEDTLQALAAPAGLALSFDRTCARHQNVFGNTTLCTGTGSSAGYVFSFTISSPQPGVENVLVFGVEAANE